MGGSGAGLRPVTGGGGFAGRGGGGGSVCGGWGRRREDVAGQRVSRPGETTRGGAVMRVCVCDRLFTAGTFF